MPRMGDVVEAYRPKFHQELRTEWAVALLYRPLSLVLTPLVVAVSAPPSFVTALALVCALLLPLLAWHGAVIAVGVLAVLFCVLDCVDGDVARVTGRVTRRGAYADFLADIVYRIALYASIGMLTDALALGLACALLAITARACRLYLGEEPGGEWRATPGAVAFAFLSGLDHALPIAVIVLGFAGRLEWLPAWLLAYSLGDFVATQGSAFRRLR